MKTFLFAIYLMFGIGLIIELDSKNLDHDLDWPQVVVGAAVWPVWAGMIVMAMLHDKAGI